MNIVGGKLFVIGRARDRKRVLLGGLGCLGVGQMWSDESDFLKNEPNFETCPELIEEPTAAKNAIVEAAILRKENLQ